jgi:hypothetical protein
MHMRVMLQLLVPCVQHAEEANLRAEQSRIARHLEQGFSAGAEQELVDNLLVSSASGANSCGRVKTTWT